MELAVDPLERDDADFWGPLMTVAGRCLGTLMHSELRSSSMASLTRLQVPGTVNVQSGGDLSVYHLDSVVVFFDVDWRVWGRRRFYDMPCLFMCQGPLCGGLQCVIQQKEMCLTSGGYRGFGFIPGIIEFVVKVEIRMRHRSERGVDGPIFVATIIIIIGSPDRLVMSGIKGGLRLRGNPQAHELIVNTAVRPRAGNRRGGFAARGAPVSRIICRRRGFAVGLAPDACTVIALRVEFRLGGAAKRKVVGRRVEVRHVCCSGGRQVKKRILVALGHDKKCL